MKKKTSDLQFRLEYAGFRLVAFILRCLPLEAGSALMGFIWSRIAPLTRRQARVLEHLAVAFPSKSSKELKTIARASWFNLGQTFAEGFQIDRVLADPGRITGNHEAILKRLKEEGDGGIFLSFHHGNWEIITAVGVEGGLSMAGIYQKIKNPYVDAYITSARVPYYPAGLFAKGKAAVKGLMQVVQSGNYIGVLADLRERRGVVVSFFGKPAPSNPFPATLACRYNKPVFVVRPVRLPGVNFRIDVVEIAVSRTGDQEHDIRETTQAVQKQFEDWLREKPDQFMWAHKRWI